jgi:hypothetical protein
VSGPIRLDCDRECLRSVVDGYLDALASNDPTGLGLSEDVRYSENGQILDVGDGLWKTVSRRGGDGLYFADSPMGQAAFLGTMQEGERTFAIALRIRIELGRITEVETSNWRPEGEAASVLAGLPGPAWLEAIAPSERLSRPEIIAVANAYFDALETDDSQEIQRFAVDCLKVANRGPAVPCRDEFEGNEADYVTRVHQRRFPLVDEERGAVWAYAVLDHDGTTGAGAAPSQAVSPEALLRPSSRHLAGALLVGDLRIRRMETVEVEVPYHMNLPWEGGLSGR